MFPKLWFEVAGCLPRPQLLAIAGRVRGHPAVRTLDALPDLKRTISGYSNSARTVCKSAQCSGFSSFRRAGFIPGASFDQDVGSLVDGRSLK